MSERSKVTPCACFSHDDKDGRFKIGLELPGSTKKTFNSICEKIVSCVSAPKGTETEYSGCYNLAHEIVPEKAEAKYESGLLRILAPIRDWEHKVSVMIQ